MTEKKKGEFEIKTENGKKGKKGWQWWQCGNLLDFGRKVTVFDSAIMDKSNTIPIVVRFC
jgi:hypothetical protein